MTEWLIARGSEGSSLPVVIGTRLLLIMLVVGLGLPVCLAWGVWRWIMLLRAVATGQAPSAEAQQ